MVDNTALNQECDKLQQAFWGNKNSDDPNQKVSLNDCLGDVDRCWQQHSKDVPEEVDALYNKLLVSTRFFVNFSEPFLCASATSNDVSEKKDGEPINPNTILTQYLEAYIEVMEQGSQYNLANADIKGFWKLPLELWQQQLSILGELPEPFVQFIKSSTAEGNTNTEIFTEAFIDACDRYLEVVKEYQSAYLAMSLRAAKGMLTQLQRHQAKDHYSADTVCQLWMDTWIEVFEKHYADFVRDDDYSKLYADVINSWMLVIQQTEKLITPWLKAMNMPTRDDV